MGVLEKVFMIDKRAFNKIKKKANGVFDYEEEMKNLSDEELKAKTPYFKDLSSELEIVTWNFLLLLAGTNTVFSVLSLFKINW